MKYYPSGFGAQRARRCRSRGYRCRTIDRSRAQEQIDEIGALAELFVARRYGQEHQVMTGRPSSCDLVNGHSHLDVKHTAWPGGQLLKYQKWTDRDEEHWCTAYVLVVGDVPERFEMAGWAWGYELQRSWNVTLPRACWALPQASLHPNVDMLMAATFGWFPVDRDIQLPLLPDDV